MGFMGSDETEEKKTQEEIEIERLKKAYRDIVLVSLYNKREIYYGT